MPPTPTNGSAELLRKAIQDASPGRPTWGQIALTDREQALCGVIDHYVRLHLGERDRLSRRLATLELQLARHRTEHAHGFRPNTESTR